MIKLNPYLKDFWKKKAPIKVLYGGRSSSKTHDTAGALLIFAATYKLKIACVRKFQANIENSVYTVLKNKIENDYRFIDQFNVTKTSMRSKTGSEFIFLGWEKNTSQIKGLEAVDIMWVEEGETLTEEQWDIIEPTISLRKENTMIVIVFNPNLETDFVYDNFIKKQQDNVVTKKINYNNNCFLPDSAKITIENKRKTLDEDKFNNIYLGYPKKDGENSFIKRSWIEACIDAHKKLNIEVVGKNNIGYDIADDGEDQCATCMSKGILLLNIDQWQAKTDELEKSAERVYMQALKTNSDISYDCIGVGASAGSTFKRLNKDTSNKIRYNKFRAGDTVDKPNQYYEDKIKNKDHFDNLKAQAWQNIADRMLTTYNAVTKGYEYVEDDIISLSSEIQYLDTLIIELSSPKTDVSNRGLVSVESKIKMSKRGIKSPNIADAFIMCFYKQKTYSMRDML